jgi:hypothetical protein
MLTPVIMAAQPDTSASNLSLSGYVEVYYAYDFNQPFDHNRPLFFYSHNRHNELNLNLGFLKASYHNTRVRANLGIASGTYMNINYAAEPGPLKNIYEANAGVMICKKKNVWLDAGIFASHIGFESAVSIDSWTLTRSILADNSPYYESGIKLTYRSEDNKWLLSGLMLNGWQHIHRPDGNNTPAFGTQFTFTPRPSFALNYSTFIGNDKPDDTKQMRYFHNLYGIFQLADHVHLTAGFDFGMEQRSKGSMKYNHWYSPVLILKITINEKWSVTGRTEYFADEDGVIILTETTNGFKTFGYSINMDYKIRNGALRVEGRMLSSRDPIFTRQGHAVNTNTFVTTSFAISF